MRWLDIASLDVVVVEVFSLQNPLAVKCNHLSGNQVECHHHMTPLTLVIMIDERHKNGLNPSN